MTIVIEKNIGYYLSEHPAIVGFRWSPTYLWGATWSSVFSSIAAYVVTSIFVHIFVNLILFRRDRRPLSMGPFPALHSLSMAFISVTIFVGILLSTCAEIRDTRWFWRRSKTTPVQWLLCFPVGTRPSGRVFFWSYVYYLYRFLHTFRTFFTIIGRRKLSWFQLFNNSIIILMSFLWLEFSQSFQILGILLATSVYAVVYGYRFWTAIGLPRACSPFVVNCHILLLGCNLVCNFGVLWLHFIKKGGCNGIGAWVINSLLNGPTLLLFLNFYMKMYLRRRSRNLNAKQTDTVLKSSATKSS